ncbi:unnamed protein product, partial [Rotaria sordida]
MMKRTSLASPIYDIAKGDNMIVICVMEENKPASQLLLPITDDYSISTGFLNKYFPNGLGLKFKTTHSDIYQAVVFDVEHEKFIIGEENLKLNYVYVVHRIN